MWLLFPVCVKLRIKMFTRFFGGGGFRRPTAEVPEPICTHNKSNDAVPRRDVPFRDQKIQI